MGLIEHWPVYLCDEHDDEYGPADPGDTSCCYCGRAGAKHIYVPEAAYRGAVDALWAIVNETSDDPQRIKDAAREALADLNAGPITNRGQ